MEFAFKDKNVYRIRSKWMESIFIKFSTRKFLLFFSCYNSILYSRYKYTSSLHTFFQTLLEPRTFFAYIQLTSTFLFHPSPFPPTLERIKISFSDMYIYIYIKHALMQKSEKQLLMQKKKTPRAIRKDSKLSSFDLRKFFPIY